MIDTDAEYGWMYIIVHSMFSTQAPRIEKHHGHRTLHSKYFLPDKKRPCAFHVGTQAFYGELEARLYYIKVLDQERNNHQQMLSSINQAGAINAADIYRLRKEQDA